MKLAKGDLATECRVPIALAQQTINVAGDILGVQTFCDFRHEIGVKRLSGIIQIPCLPNQVSKPATARSRREKYHIPAIRIGYLADLITGGLVGLNLFEQVIFLLPKVPKGICINKRNRFPQSGLYAS
ncbi:MAG TPA: hypothetical protein VJ929_10435 [Roseovarius sp.]|nr:hypothetical protein [Roseovarius sp.]